MGFKRSVLIGTGFIAALACELVSGSLRGTFNAYNEALKQQLSLDQQQVTLLGSVSFFGYFALINGFIHDKVGPKFAMLLGMLFAVTGYAGVWLILKGEITTSYPLLLAFFVFIGIGNGFGFFIFVSQVANFPYQYRGSVIGSMSLMFALSGALFAPIYTQTYGKSIQVIENDVAGFMLLMAILHLITYFICIAIVDIYSVDITGGNSVNEGLNPKSEKKKDATLLQELSRIDYWIIVLAPSSAIPCLVFIYTIGFVAVSFFGRDSTTSKRIIDIATVLFAVFGALGRLLGGVLNDLGNKLWPQTGSIWFLLCVNALNALTNIGLLFLMDKEWYLYIACISVGLVFGIFGSLPQSMIASWYNIKHLGFLTGMGGFFLAMAFTAVQAASSAMYDSHIVGDGTDCFGKACWEGTFALFTALSLMGVWLTIVLFYVRPNKSTNRK